MDLKKIQIKETNTSDFDNIMTVEKQAFGYDKEAKLVAELLTDETAEPIVSLLAFYDNKAIGHILFTRAYIEGVEEHPMIHILAPLAVIPEFQQQGVGGLLIKAGIRLLQERGAHLIFVLGHKEYYPKHGFIPDAGGLGYPAPYPIPNEYADYWMVLPIGENKFDTVKGKIRCSETLNRPEHWRDDESDRQ
ncbi:N-acetyltransferase [Massilibacteroides sp.]|uniref:GNAT family N-acetyltransferase n=1 Tax=Massilibacteroides sp. TaxID=2034766 RepID=UPI002639CFA1|nr:N-acetyltransferase [Massilibacteroides sp.]MDD4516034.1 N-acetyltransferase [Massilibacteroides sp.]